MWPGVVAAKTLNNRHVSAAALLLALACVTAAAQDPAPTSARRVTIAATGDILLHIKVNKAAETHGWAHLFGSLARHLPEEHIAFANLETPLVDDIVDVVTGSPPVLGSRGEAAAALAAAGFDVLACANNHAFDQRSGGAARTIDHVRRAAMVSVGVERDEESLWRPKIVRRGGLRVAFLAASDGLNRGPGRPAEAFVAASNDPRLMDAIAAAREQADVVVLAIHWSYDYAPVVSFRQRRQARQWVEAGVDFVLGTGPHVLQSVERIESPRGSAVIAYSLGNLISNQGQRWEPGRRVSMEAHPAVRLPATRDGVLLRTTFSAADGRVEVDAIRGVPLFTENNFWPWWRSHEIGHDIRVVPLEDADPSVRSARAPAIAEALGDVVELEFSEP